ncbi:MAG TPA: lysophospholipid acyltransferase family protein [Gemmatimonadales bacterium]|nr:lysophospholipid acyltransferase family protein [Gemmatimonadales bacterium]
MSERRRAPAATEAPRAPFPPMVAWFDRYFRRLARRHFAGIHWISADDPSGWDDLPVLAVANHSTWWDGPLAFLLSSALGRRFHVAMDAAHLARHPYFGWIGAHPLRRTTPRERWTDLERFGAALRPGTVGWIFPQGERRPARAPLDRFERGAAHLALTRAPVRVVPVGIRLAHTSEQLPEAFLRLGPSFVVGRSDPRDRRALAGELERALARTLIGADALIDRELRAGWRPLFPPTLSVNKRLERLGHRLGLLDGQFAPRNG